MENVGRFLAEDSLVLQLVPIVVERAAWRGGKAYDVGDRERDEAENVSKRASTSLSMVGGSEKLIRGVYFMSKGVNGYFLLDGIISTSAPLWTSTPLWSGQGYADAGQCEGDDHCEDHFYFEVLEGIAKLGTFLYVARVGREGLAGDCFEPASGFWRAG